MRTQAVPAKERAAVADALRLADLWLDEVTQLPSGVQTIESWTRLEWLDRTLPVWRSLCDPVAERVVAAMSSALPSEGEQAAELGEAMGAMGALLPAGGIGAIMNQIGGLMFGAQVGQGLAGLAGEVVSSTDIGIPLGPTGVSALVPANVAAFGAGLERPAEEVRLYLALREAAHQRLFTHVPWLRQRMLDTVAAYAQGISVDLSAIERAMGDIDPTNPESVQEALSGGLFEPETTPEQQAALRRLETLLALVEGWVDAVVAAAANERMPGGEALREASRRRRATGGPAEQTFATLVGLELRPRRLREAAALWWAVTEKHGDQRTRRRLGAPRSATDRRGPRRPARLRRHGGSARHAPCRRRAPRSCRAAAGRLERRHVLSGERLARVGRQAVSAALSSPPCSMSSTSPARSSATSRWAAALHPVEIAAGSLGSRIALHQGPEVRAVPRHQQMCELVHQHVVAHPVRHVLQALGEPDGGVRRRARRPAGAHAGTHRTLAGCARPAEVTGRQLGSPPRQRGIAGAAAPMRARVDAPDHLSDPPGLLGRGEPRRDHDHDPRTVAVRRHRAAPTRAAPHLHLMGGDAARFDRAGWSRLRR